MYQPVTSMSASLSLRSSTQSSSAPPFTVAAVSPFDAMTSLMKRKLEGGTTDGLPATGSVIALSPIWNTIVRKSRYLPSSGANVTATYAPAGTRYVPSPSGDTSTPSTLTETTLMPSMSGIVSGDLTRTTTVSAARLKRSPLPTMPADVTSSEEPV